MRNHRTHLGKRFSEGARLLWCAMDAKRIGVADAARELGCGRGSLANILYGERRPGIEAAKGFHDAFGVPIESWIEAPREPFIPPAARTAAA